MYRLLYAEGVEKHSAGTERRAHFYSPPPQDRDRLLLACLILTHACVCLFAYLPIYISGYLWPVVTRIGPSHRHRYAANIALLYLQVTASDSLLLLHHVFFTSSADAQL